MSESSGSEDRSRETKRIVVHVDPVEYARWAAFRALHGGTNDEVLMWLLDKYGSENEDEIKTWASHF